MNGFISDFIKSCSSSNYNNVSISVGYESIQIHQVSIHCLINEKANTALNFHSHSCNELHFALAGDCSYQFKDGRVINVREGQWLMIPGGYLHKVISFSSTFVKFSFAFTLLDDNGLPAAYISDYFSDSEPKLGQTNKNHLNAIEQIYHEIKNSYLISLYIIRNNIGNIILDMVSSQERKIPTDRRIKTNDNESRLLLATQFIEDNIYHNIKSDDVSNCVHISTKQLNRIFKAKMDTSVAAYITDRKIQKAQEMLLKSTASANEISEKLGFDDCSYFIKYFTKHSGISPKAFRQKALSDAGEK